MRWPWVKRETRSASYGDEVVAMLLARAEGSATVADALQTAALEVAAGTVGRAFMAAQIDGALGPELEPHLEFVGRSFVRRGECVLVPSDTGFERATAWDITGGEDWNCAVTVPRPSATETFELDSSRLLHFRAAESRSRPWKGRSPLDVGETGAKLLAGLESGLANEANGPHGSILPVPVNPNEKELEALKESIRTLNGRTFIAETQRGGWGDQEQRASGAHDWAAQRLGANPPEGVISLLVEHRRAVLAACGVPPELLGGADGAARREAWRTFVYGTLAPYGYAMEREVNATFGADIRVKWDRLRAADVSGRGRAYGSLIDAGMDAARAETLVGFAD